MMNDELERLKKDFLSHICQTSDEPMGIIVDHAFGSTIVDRYGKTYLDFISGIGVANVGHSHPAVVRAIADQASRHLHVMVYGEFIQAAQVHLAKQLADVVPPPLSVTYFTNSGTEAVEGALKTAKKRTGRKNLIAFTGSFHGDSQGSLSVTGRDIYRKPFLPLLSNVTFLPFNQTQNLEVIDSETAAVIIEPIQGEGGVHIPSDDFLPALRKRCDQTGALLIFDEVMTGLGRTGRLFACQHWNVTPDMMILAKALGGGMPLGAFISRPDILKTLSEDPPLSHVSTFGGHPVCCAAGLAALEVVFKEDLPAQASQKGKRILKTLTEWRNTIGGIRDVRGKGLLIGLELESSDITRRFVTACREAGLILGWTLHSDCLVRLAPPLVMTEHEIDTGLSIIQAALMKSLRHAP